MSKNTVSQSPLKRTSIRQSVGWEGPARAISVSRRSGGNSARMGSSGFPDHRRNKSCSQPFKYSTCEQGNVQVRGLQCPSFPGTRPGLIVSKTQIPSRSGAQPSKSAAIRVRRCGLRIIRVVVFPRGVGLPQFNHRVGYGSSISIQHSTDDAYMFPICPRAGQAVDRVGLRAAQVKERAHGLRWSRYQISAQGKTADISIKLAKSGDFHKLRSTHPNFLNIA